jgi:isoleucyl-tRNA synthetase
MPFKDVSSKTDFIALEHEMLAFWRESDAFNTLRRLRAETEAEHGIFSFVDGPITANNPMGVHHAWGRTYKDLYQRYQAMLGKNQRWQNGFDCQGLWVEVNVEKDLGFKSKRDIEAFGLAEFVRLCKMRVLKYSAVQTAQSIRLGYWMDWNDLESLQQLHDLMQEDDQQIITLEGPQGRVTGTVEQLVGQLGMPQLGGSYYTFSDENNYQIWAYLKACFERGWLYQGTDVMTWCARCGTGISHHEIVTDGYHDVTHDSIFLRLPLTRKGDAPAGELAEKEALLVWTTTPWTLSSNVAAAVGPELDYVQVKSADGWHYWLAEGALKNSLIGDHEIITRLKGADLIGWEYAGPFDRFPVVQQTFAEADYTHRVIGWKEVGAAEGTGIVHIAPGCGAEDFALSKEHTLPVLAPLDENGIFLPGYDWQSGQSVFAVKDGVFDHLRNADSYYRKQRYSHRYPHCWRCQEELVYRLVDEWYISMGPLYDKPRSEVTSAEKAASFRYQIMDAVEQANWFPAFGHEREMDWLRNMHDWMISKKRYWGLALPIYQFEDGSFYVVGSREELRELAVEGWDEFDGHTPHRPYIDAVKIRHPQSGLIGSRIKDVGNPWLDAGIVAISTLRYSSDPDYWRKWYPADWISESFPGQFRNWFYSLLAQSTLMTQDALGRTVGPFKNLFGYSTLLAEDGREMHKSWGNSIAFEEGADTMGADTMRWLYASCRPEKNLLFGYTVGDETRRRFLIPLWNVTSFFVTYANLDGWQPESADRTPSDNPGNVQLDAWIEQRLHETALEMGRQLDQYDAHRATVAAEAFLEDLSNWYVRRSRRRFWRGELDVDKRAAFSTLWRVLVGFVQLLAPFIPFTAEAIYQNLVAEQDASAPRSVHHTLWPRYAADALDRPLLDKMRLAITVAGLGRAARSSADLKLRQPLARARINVGSEQARADLLELTEVLQEEINVKGIDVVAEVGELVDYRILPNNRLLGPRLGQRFPAVRQALAALDPAVVARTLQETGSVAVPVGGEMVTLSADDVIVQTVAKGDFAVAGEQGVTVAVDTHLTPALVQEGYARDIVRHLNNARKDAGFDISDRIHVWYQAEGDAAEALRTFGDFIAAETLAVVLEAGSGGAFSAELQLDGTPVRLGLSRRSQ